MPLMFEQFLNVMVGMVDTLMVSKAEKQRVSGVALTTNINLLIIQVMAALDRRCRRLQSVQRTA